MKRSKKILTSLLLTLGLSSTAQAWESSPALQQCARQNNITLPAQGSGEPLTADQKKALFSCVKAARKAAFQSCAAQADFNPTRGQEPAQKPTEQQHQAIHQCMIEQGFKGHWGHHHRPHFNGTNVTPPQTEPAAN
jgi:hypothetical protein